MGWQADRNVIIISSIVLSLRRRGRMLLMYELKYDSFVFGSRKGIVYYIVFVLCRSASIGFHSPYYPVIFLTYDLRNLLLLWQHAVPNHHAVGPDLSKPVKWASPTRTLSLGMAHPGRNSSLPGEFPGRREGCQRCWGHAIGNGSLFLTGGLKVPSLSIGFSGVFE